MAGDTLTIPIDVERAGPKAVALYREIIASGESQNFAEMIACRQAPGVQTDNTFLAGIGTLRDQFDGDDFTLNEVVQVAQASGYSPKSSDFYNESLARFPGDPEAFLHAGQGRDHIKKVCEKRGTGCRGAVNVKGRGLEKDPFEGPPKLAPDLVNEEINRRVAANPDEGRRPRKELAAEVVDKHALKL